MSNTLLTVRDLRIQVANSGQALLEGASFELHAGERLTIVGESGAGKSILAQAIMGLLPAALRASGQVHIDGIATQAQRALTQPLWGRSVVMLPQEPSSALSPLMRMLAQVAEAAHYTQGIPWRAAQERALAQLHQLGIGAAAQQWLHHISGGMAQRVGVAASSLSQAKLIIADEPTKGLDIAAREQVAQLLLAMQGAGQALLTITHDLALAQRLGGQLLVLQAGRVVESGQASAVLSQPQHAYTQALVAAQPQHWPRLVSPLTAGAPPVLHAHALSKRYGDKRLFNDVSLTLQRGEIASVSGASGCGKTTLGNILLGLTSADSGQVTRMNAAASAFQKLYQDPPAAFAPARRLRDALRDLIALHQLDERRIEPLLAQLKLDPSLLERYPTEVSGGQLQRIALLRLLLLDPVFIFADEPSSRLDVITQLDTMKVLLSAAQHQACTILLVSHDADLARACSHQHLSWC